MERLARLRAHLAAGADVSDPHAARVGAAAADGELLGPALQVVERAVAQQRIPGASIAVMRRGELVASAGFGTRDPGASDDPPPFEGDSICYIASLTKPFTAAAGMLLVERGDLGLDDLVSDHLPDFADVQTEDGRAAGHLLTVRDLMCHRSGLGRAFPADLRPSPFFTQAWFSESLESVVAGISKLPLAFLPREDVAYSNTAWYVLARIVELRTGEHFGDFVRREIFGRLGMEDTGFGLPAAKVGRTAVCYSAGAPTIAGVRAEGSDDDDALSLVSKYESSWDVQVRKASLERSESQGSPDLTRSVCMVARDRCACRTVGCGRAPPTWPAGRAPSCRSATAGAGCWRPTRWRRCSPGRATGRWVRTARTARSSSAASASAGTWTCRISSRTGASPARWCGGTR